MADDDEVSGHAAVEFKIALRRLARSAGFDRLQDLEAKSSLSHSTVSDAFNPRRRLPSDRTVHAIVTAAGGDVEEWLRLRSAAEKTTAVAPVDEPTAIAVLEDEPLTVDGGGTDAGTSGSVDRQGRPSRRWAVVLVGGAVVVVGGLVVWIASTGRGSTGVGPSGVAVRAREVTAPASEQTGTVPETAIPDNAVSTLRDPLTARGLGVKIEASQTVEVSCRIFSGEIPSALPDGWFYRIESEPWSGEYYAAANSFLNGDPPGDPALYVTPTDLSVPVCPS